MLRDDPIYFDIDVDLSPILGTEKPLLMSNRWYQLLYANPAREALSQREIEDAFHTELLYSEWEARGSRVERRCTLRAPILSGVRVERGSRLVATRDHDPRSAGRGRTGRPGGDRPFRRHQPEDRLHQDRG